MQDDKEKQDGDRDAEKKSKSQHCTNYVQHVKLVRKGNEKHGGKGLLL